MYHTITRRYHTPTAVHRIVKKKPVTPIARWVCTFLLPHFSLPAPPPCLPSTSTHMRASTWHRQRRIHPAGWTVPIVPLMYRRRRIIVVIVGRTIIVILVVINIFFSSFIDADPSHIMLVDCCMLCCRECGPIMAVWGRRPPWSIYSIAFYPILSSFFI